jgi:propionyl-CoA carboxylase alpha chain
VSGPQIVIFDVAGTDVEVGWVADRAGYAFVDRYGEVEGGRAAPAVRIDGGWRVTVERDGVTAPYDVFLDGDHVDVEGPTGHVTLTRKPRFVDPADQVAEGSLLAPMPGSVVAVHTESGATVSSGQPVLVLEAMKMQHTIAAPHDGVVSEIPVAVGDQVTAGAVLAVVQPTQQPEHPAEHSHEETGETP